MARPRPADAREFREREEEELEALHSWQAMREAFPDYPEEAMMPDDEEGSDD